MEPDTGSQGPPEMAPPRAAQPPHQEIPPRSGNAGPKTVLHGRGGARGSHRRGEIASGTLRGTLGGDLDGLGLAGLAYGGDALCLSFRTALPQYKDGRKKYLAFREDVVQAAKTVDITSTASL